MSEADFERERAQLFQKLGLRYDPELLNSDNGPSTLQVKTALKRRTTAPPGVGASLLQQPADVPAPAQRKASVLADVTKSQIPTPAVREQTPEARQRATSPSPISNSVHAAGEERQENSSCTPEANGRASSPNRKLSSQITIAEPSIVASASNGGTAHEPHQGTGKEGQKPSLLSVPKVIKSLKPPSSSVDPPAFASPLNKSVSASAIPGTKRPTEAQLVRKASVPEQESLVDEGDNTKRPLPTGIKPPSKPFDVGTPARSEHTPSQGSGKIPLRRDSMGSIQRPATQQQLSSEHSNGSLPVPQPKLVNTTNGHTPDQKKTKNPNNLRIGSESQTSNGHVPLGTDGINFGNCTHCGLAVVGVNQGCMALENLYHTGCFSCSKCGQVLDNKTFYVTSSNEVLCEKDYFFNLPKCHKCLLHIENRVVHAGGATYHPGCFRCVVCGKEMEKVPFASDDVQHIYCERDYHLKFSPKCSTCGDPITPQLGKAKSMRVKAMGKYFHLECYKCEVCDVELARVGCVEKKCYPVDDHLLCKDCSKRRMQEATPPRDTATPSPVPHVKITPSTSPSPPLAWESGH